MAEKRLYRGLVTTDDGRIVLGTDEIGLYGHPKLMKRADEIGKSERNRRRSHMRSFRVVPQEFPKIP